jgi:hypothetical protein
MSTPALRVLIVGASGPCHHDWLVGFEARHHQYAGNKSKSKILRFFDGVINGLYQGSISTLS